MKFEGQWHAEIGFRQFLKTIVDDNCISVFKCMRQYQEIVGCDSYGKDAADILANDIIDKYPEIVKAKNSFKQNDKIGKPPIEQTKLGEFSPNTLRYMLVLGELGKFIGNLSNKKIIEIGSAYGGQALIISCLYKWKKYTMIDFPEAIELTSKYLDHFALSNINLMPTDKIVSEKSDVIISNFALTELDRTGFNFYYDNFFTKTQSFYILSNTSQDFFLETLSKLFDISKYSEPELKKHGTGIWVGKRKD